MDTSEDAKQKLMRQIAESGRKVTIAPHELPRLATQQVSQNPTERLLSGKVIDFREAIELYIKQYDLRDTGPNGTNCMDNHYQAAAQIALIIYTNHMEDTQDELAARDRTLDDLYMETLHGDHPEIIDNELEIIRDALLHEDYATLAM